MSARRERDESAFQLILESGEEGILQSEMCKILGADSQEGSRIAVKFLEREAIKRQRELHDGRWTYRLISIKKPVTINSIMTCPCISCEDLEKCTPGRFVSPINCPHLTEWINEGTEKA